MALPYDVQIYGPIDPSVLTDQANHKSEDVFIHTENEILLRSRRADNHYFKNAYPRTPHRRVLNLLNDMGFYRIYKLRKFNNDMGLITALVERWRPETNTFHFRTGEATVTLQDIAIIYGLPIDGRPVVAHRVFTDMDDCKAFTLQLLGIEIEDSDMSSHGHRIKVKKIVDHVTSVAGVVTNESNDVVVEQVTRCWAFMLLGAVMCPDSSGDVISLDWLKLFENMNEVQTYSWGSAVLAYLYRALYNASQRCTGKKKNIAGPLSLLQIWAWSRITVVKPDGVPNAIAGVDVHDIARAPYGARWYGPLTNTNTLQHTTVGIRDGLDQMGSNHFVWTPYNLNDADIAELPRECLNNHVWRASVPLIFNAIVEHHRPERVLRQFGMQQNIPHAIKLFTRVDRRGKPNVNWISEHATPIHTWNNRFENFVDGQVIMGGDNTKRGYNLWYDRITRRYISPKLNRRTVGHPIGSAALLQDVHNHIEDMDAVVQSTLDEIPESRNALKRAFVTIKSDINNIKGLVSCTHNDDVVSGADRTVRRRCVLEEAQYVEEDDDDEMPTDVEQFVGGASSSQYNVGVTSVPDESLSYKTQSSHLSSPECTLHL